MRSILLAAFTGAVLLPAQFAMGQAKATPETTDVEASIVGPDSKPLIKTAVEFSDRDKHPNPHGIRAHSAATTDEQGVARFRWKTGVNQVSVKVKGVGYGMCGLTEFIPNVTSKPVFPPLAPYATISASIPQEVIGKAVRVRIFNGGIDEEARTASIDPTGRFEFIDLMTGGSYLEAQDAEGRSLVRASLDLNPGVHIQAVTFRPATKEEADEEAELDEEFSTQPIFASGRDADGKKMVQWATGTIRALDGQPLSGVDVYAVATYHGGIRMYEVAHKTKTDENGRYAISGEDGLKLFSRVIVAHKRGFVPALDWFDRPGMEGVVGQPPKKQLNGKIDLTLTDRGGTLHVRVLEHGKPAAGVSVVVRGAGAGLRDQWAAATHGLRPEIESFLYPERITNDRGEVHFKLLMPDWYEVIAARHVEVNGEKLGARIFHGVFADQGRSKPYAVADGVAVRTGESQSLRMRIFQQDYRAGFAFHGTDGDPLTGNVPLGCVRAHQSGESISSTKLDETGAGTHAFESAGLWRVECKYERSPVHSYPGPSPPYDLATGIVAVSAAMRASAQPIFTARSHQPGVAEIEVVDVDGRPVEAVVEIRFGDFQPSAIGATNQAGFVRLEGVMESSHLKLSARPIGVDAGDVRPMHAGDAALRGKVFFPVQSGLIKGDQLTRLIVRQVPAGYVRGKLLPAPGTNTKQYNLYVRECEWQCSYDPATGDYLAGPLVAGEATIGIQINGYNKAGEQEVTVIGGDLVHADLTAKLTDLPPQSRDVLIDAAGASSLSPAHDLLRGSVLLFDGKTPAYGAVVDYFRPHEYQPLYSGMTDVHGKIHSRGRWHRQEASGEEPPGGPTEPVVVAYLPGACGAVIAPLPKKGQNLSLVLPPQLVLRGKVTVAGADAWQQIGTIRVYAAYEGKGVLNGILSAGATAQANGAYELAGLTPGTYRVQAALDDIWLSASQTVEVKNQAPAPINLEIGRPGAPLRVKVTDEQGAVLPGRTVSVERPAGRLATALWPQGFETDGAGIAWIPTLEAGKHTLLLDGEKTEVDVPALPAPDAVEVSIVAKRDKLGQ